MMKSVVIVAGGSGSRMKSEIPKQFINIKGKPVIVWTIEKFQKYQPGIQVIVVLPEKHMLIWDDILQKFPRLRKIEITAGGINRSDSVQNGLELVKNSSLVAIHDAVRPLVSTETINRCFLKAEKKGCAIPVIDSEDSLRLVEEQDSEIIDRNNIKRVQTPQVFIAEKIKTAYINSFIDNLTDDASVYESYYGEVVLVKGNKENIKITYPADILYAESMLSLS